MGGHRHHSRYTSRKSASVDVAILVRAVPRHLHVILVGISRLHPIDPFRSCFFSGSSFNVVRGRDASDGFSPLLMAQGEVRRILNALNSNEDSDSDGLDPDHPMTCKICMDAIVEVSLVAIRY